MAQLIFGCGYLGRRVARLWRSQGRQVWAVTRSESTAKSLAADGLSPLVADLLNPNSLSPVAQLPEIDTVLFAVGFDHAADRSIHEVYVDGLANALQNLPNSVRRLIYISSTGVYGQTDSEWVEESSPCRPVREGGKACLAAEQLLSGQTPFQTTILRLAGIYGPNRIPRAKQLLAGEPIAAPSEGYLNLIHVDDAAQIVLLAAEHPNPAHLYCVSDGHPVLRSGYYAELARLLGAPPSRFESPSTNSPAAQRAASDKKVSNQRLLHDLAPRLKYPSYREGLRAIIAQDAST